MLEPGETQGSYQAAETDIQMRLTALKGRELAKRSEQRWERDKATSRCRHGLSASPHHLASTGGGDSVTHLQQQPFSSTKRHCKTKAGERSTKEVELVQETLAYILDAHKKMSVQKYFLNGLYGSEKNSEIAIGI